MEMVVYHVATNPDMYDKLKKQLRNAFQDPSTDLNYTTLEKLPYLTGVMKGDQRLSYGIISQLARATPEGLARLFNGIPTGVCLPL